MTNDDVIHLTEEDLKEIFSLFSSPSKDELQMMYNKDHYLYFKQIDLDDEYELSQARRDFALDAWRAVTYFLSSEGYSLTKGGKVVDLSFAERLFIGSN